VKGKGEGITDNDNGSQTGEELRESGKNKEEGNRGEGDGGDDKDEEGSGAKKGVSGNEKKRKLASRTSGRGKK
jgi:hypothetical protein